MKNAVVAVSGGSDSLALLDILFKKQEYNLIVCHVNYNYRDSSKRDEEKVLSYCNKRNITCLVLDLDSKNLKKGNFENWARVERYKYFKKIYDQYNCECLFVGHQKEDSLETYLIQKQRGAIVENYGLASTCEIMEMKVVRPLLGYTKKELEDYCKNNQIDYGVDETNFDLNYLRNKMRHTIIPNLTNKEKENLFNEMSQLNKIRNEEVKKIKQIKSQCLIKNNILNLIEFNKLEHNIKKEVLYYFLIDNLLEKISIRDSRIEDLIKKIDCDKPNLLLATYNNLQLYKEYDCLVISKELENYCYEIDDVNNKVINERFSISQEGKELEKVIASKKMFPLYLKNYEGNNKSINRIFINKKVPLRLRKNWPIIVDKFGGILLVIGIKKFYNKVVFNEDIVKFYVHENKGE